MSNAADAKAKWRRLGGWSTWHNNCGAVSDHPRIANTSLTGAILPLNEQRFLRSLPPRVLELKVIIHLPLLTASHSIDILI
eukprot:4498535-Pleurochrysis_carterae.AAC.2